VRSNPTCYAPLWWGEGEKKKSNKHYSKTLCHSKYRMIKLRLYIKHLKKKIRYPSMFQSVATSPKKKGKKNLIFSGETDGLNTKQYLWPVFIDIAKLTNLISLIRQCNFFKLLLIDYTYFISNLYFIEGCI